jgi:hypothetical protein
MGEFTTRGSAQQNLKSAEIARRLMNAFSTRWRVDENLESAIHGAAKADYRAALHKPGRKGRLYRIDEIGVLQWRCEAWFGVEVHRTCIVQTRTDVIELRKQYEREVDDLVLDGWVLE